MPRIFVAIFAVLLGPAVFPSRAAPADAPSDVSPPQEKKRFIAIEKAIQGSLPNGLRYVFLPHGSSKEGIGLRLIVQAGSLDERDDERGFAHFVEHMAFNGTQHFPSGTVRLFFEGLGVRFGADLNASTSYAFTQYLLDLPAGRADRLDEALILLRDYADGQLFLPEEVKQESKVVVSEMHAGDVGGRRTAIERLGILHEGTLVGKRTVIGLEDQLAGATADQLRAFYRRNYSPNRMVLLIVGRVDPTELTGKISEIFGSMVAAPASVAPYAEPEPLLTPGIKPAVMVLPTKSNSAATEFCFSNLRPPDTVEGRRQEIIQRIAINVLDRHLEAKQEREVLKYPYRPLIRTERSVSSPALMRHSVALSSLFDDWPDAVQFIESELRRGREGFPQAEIDEAIAMELAALQNSSPAASKESAGALTAELAERIIAGREWQAPTVRQAEAKAALAGLTPAEVATEFSRIFPVDSFRLILSVSSDRSVKAERILAAVEKSAGRALKAQSKAEEELQFRYDDFGPSGKIVKQERVEDLLLTLLSFENGVRLNVRPSSYEPGQFRLRIVFPQNLSDVPENYSGIADLAGHLLLNSSLKKHKQTEIIRLLRLHTIKQGFSVITGTPALSLSGPVAELPFALHYLTALLSDLEFDDDFYRVALSHYSSQYKGMLNSAGGLGLREALRVFAGDDRRVLLSNPRVFANEDGLMMTEKWLRSHLLSGPLEVGLMGDFSAESAITAAAATLGTLKTRKMAPKPGAPLALLKKAARQEAIADLQAGTAFSCVLWPVTTPDDPKKNAALALATDALRDLLLLVIREAVGATYSPQTAIHRDIIQRDFAYVGMFSTFEPEAARKYSEGSVRLAVRMAEKGLSQADFERVREPARARFAKDMRSNGWWLGEVVAQAQSRPENLVQARQHGKVLDELTLEDVNQAAQIFKSDKVTIMIVQPKPADTAAGKPTKKK